MLISKQKLSAPLGTKCTQKQGVGKTDKESIYACTYICVQDPCKTSTDSCIFFLLFLWQRRVINTATCTILSWFPSTRTFACPSGAPAQILPLLPSLKGSPVHWVIQVGARQQMCSIHTHPTGLPCSRVPLDISTDPLPA